MTSKVLKKSSLSLETPPKIRLSNWAAQKGESVEMSVGNGERDAYAFLGM